MPRVKVFTRDQNSSTGVDMAGNKKPKKRYKPKNGIGFIQLPVNFRFHQQAETELQLTPMQFMTSFVNGTGDETAWNTVVARLNIGRVLAGSHFTDQVDDMDSEIPFWPATIKQRQPAPRGLFSATSK